MEESVLCILKGYWTEGIRDWYTLYALLAVCALWLLGALVIGLFSHKGAVPVRAKATSALYYSGVITLFVALVCAMCLVKFTDFFAHHQCQLGVLLAMLIVGGITIGVYISLCKSIKRRNRLIVGYNAIPKETSLLVEKAKERMTRLWLYTILLALPFGLLLIPNNSRQLLSVIVDNSGSTNEYLNYEIVSFASVLKQTDVKCDYVLTYFKDGDYRPYESIESIVKENNQNRFHATTEELYTQVDFLNSLRSIQSGNVLGSPIYEAIWQNFLTVKDKEGYDSKKMIIITDGKDNVYCNQNGMYDRLGKNIFKYTTGKDSVSIESWYGEGRIYGINYEQETNDFYMYSDCAQSLSVKNGSDEASYRKALLEILPDLFFDYVLVYILATIAVLVSVIILISKKVIL